jgi:site-specific DNA recombinase
VTSTTRTRRAIRRPRPGAGKQPTAESGDSFADAVSRLLRVAIYIRISTDEEHQPFSLEAQDTKLRAYITTQPGWQLYPTVFRDEASGATTERPALQRALAAAKAGKFDVLLVYRVDRLSRSLRGLVQILDDLDVAGIAFRSATEPFDTSTPVGRMLVQMLGVFAQFERETIIDRVINGMERKAARGQWCGGYRPYGYELDTATGMLRPNPAEAALIPVIYRLYTSERVGSRAVAAELNERGHRTKTGHPWSGQSVLTVLRNRVYLGEVYFRGTWHNAINHHEPLIDPDTFTAAEQIMIARGEDHSRRAAGNSDYILAGKIVCAACGKRFIGNAATGNRYRYTYYTCFSRQRYGVATCTAERLPADQLHDAILKSMIDTFAATDLLGQALAETTGRQQAAREHLQAELDTVHRQLAANESSIDRYLTAFENGKMSETVAGHRVEALAQTAAALRDRRDQLQTDLDREAPKAPTAEELAALTDVIRQATTTGDTPRLRTLIDGLVHEIRVTGRHHIQPTYRLPTPRTLNPQSKVRAMTGTVPPAGPVPDGKPTRAALAVAAGSRALPGCRAQGM